MSAHIQYLGCLLAMMLSLASSPPAVGQKPPDLGKRRVEIHLKQASWAAALQALSQQLGRGVLADGDPLTRTADIEVVGTAAQALDRVAGAFDYTWTLSRSGLILMNKRFANPEERPQTDRKEMQEMSRRVLRVLSAIPYDTTPALDEANIQAVVDCLTPAQQRALEQGMAIPFRALSDRQQEVVCRACLYNTFCDVFRAWETLHVALTEFAGSRLVADLGEGRTLTGERVMHHSLTHFARSGGKEYGTPLNLGASWGKVEKGQK